MPLVTLSTVGALVALACADPGDQVAKIRSPDCDEGALFGVSVDLFGGRAIVGAQSNNVHGIGAGIAWLFDVSNPSSPRLLGDVIGDDVDSLDSFGWSVGLSDSLAIVGAPFQNSRGAAYLFDLTNGDQLARIAPGGTGGFGNAVALDSEIVVIGAPGDDELERNMGAAYVYDVSIPASPAFVAKLTSSNPRSGAALGVDVAISDTTILVGSREGIVYFFDRSTNSFVGEVHGDRDTEFGTVVAVWNHLLLVGAGRADDVGFDAGAAFLFDISDPVDPILLSVLHGGDASPGDRFGQSVAIEGNVALVGAFLDDQPENSGSVYVFDISDPHDPIQIGKFQASNAAINDWAGSSVAVHEGVALTGAPRSDRCAINAGSAYLFDAVNPCRADTDGDGDIDAEDFFAYLDLFASGDDGADIDGDGDIDAEDFFGYLDLFAAGC